MALPPLGLYVHLPWCQSKCPYCDFNSHPLREALPEAAYVEALLRDLEQEVAALEGAVVTSLFLGGGTPSLFSGRAVADLLGGIRQRVDLAPHGEITMEANPGTAEARRFAAYRRAGVNRLSLGVQSFDDDRLRRLGRIHDAGQARKAFELARSAGFDNINLDLMYGLPGQSKAQALADLDQALSLEPEHLSWYQLTLEPNTPFHHRPPPLPDHETLWAIQEAGLARLAGAGYVRYEISAFARPGRRCRHNLNYWCYGDYLGIGAGAHGKLTQGGDIGRYRKARHPRDYLNDQRRLDWRQVPPSERPLEFLMNALRLVDGVEEALFSARTGLASAVLEPGLSRLRAEGLLEPGRLQATPRGLDFLDELLLRFQA